MRYVEAKRASAQKYKVTVPTMHALLRAVPICLDTRRWASNTDGRIMFMGIPLLNISMLFYFLGHWVLLGISLFVALSEGDQLKEPVFGKPGRGC